MNAQSPSPESARLLARIEQAGRDRRLSPGAVANLRIWLREPRYAEFVSQIAEHVESEKWQELDDAFWTVIPFGTGGRRGRMYPIGCNVINDRTIGESAQGLADCVREQAGPGRRLACAIAYDTRHRSRHFAELCAGIMAAAGIKVYFLDGFRSTPELSFAVRHHDCDCGIMVTASHNPPSDNAVKVYWASGVQVLPPYDKQVIERVMRVQDIECMDFHRAMAEGWIVYCQEETDKAFLEAVIRQSRPGPRDLKIIYSPLHGVGESAVMPALEAAGFREVEVFEPHREPSGDFPNVPGHVSNPENPAVFEAIISRAKETAAELIMATDPDADRLGCAAPLSFDSKMEWGTLTGNQLAALLTDYLLSGLRDDGELTDDHYVVKTLVTSELVRRIADSYGVRTIGDLLVGFKWIGKVINEEDPEKFVFGAEESYGFLVGTHARDKDAAVASMVAAELTAKAKAEGQTLHQKLAALMRCHGCHGERTISVQMPGSEGMERIKSVMAAFRGNPPEQLGGARLAQIRDYSGGTIRSADGTTRPLDGPRGDLVILDLEMPGNYVAARPSGTEPKIKFYMFAYDPPEESQDVEAARKRQRERLDRIEADLKEFTGV